MEAQVREDIVMRPGTVAIATVREAELRYNTRGMIAGWGTVHYRHDLMERLKKLSAVMIDPFDCATFFPQPLLREDVFCVQYVKGRAYTYTGLSRVTVQYGLLTK